MSSNSSTPLSDMAQITDEDTQTSLEKIKKRLANASASCIMEGSLLKRSETLRMWNQRWFTLDPATGKMEYRVHHGDSSARGLIHFEPESTITLSPINFHGQKKFDGCCFYIGSPQKKEYYLCAETPTIARAWVSTLRAAALVLKAHKEAVDSLSGNGHAKLGTVAAVVSAANATAREGMKEIHTSLKEAVKPNLPRLSHTSSNDMSDIMRETLRVKDEELNQVARDLRARDFTIKEMADRLSETAEAAEAAASAARAMDKERRNAQSEIERLRKEFDDRLYHAAREVRAGEERLAAAMKTRENALQEAQRWRVELGKGREQIVMMEGAVVRAEESARRAAADADEKVRLAKASELGAVAAKEEAFHLAKQWQAQAEYYRDQAARYLSLLEEKDAAGKGLTMQALEVNHGEVAEKSAMDGPVGLSTPGTVGPPLVGSDAEEGDFTYDPITPELLSSDPEGKREKEISSNPVIEPSAPGAAIDITSSTETPRSLAIEIPSERSRTGPPEVNLSEDQDTDPPEAVLSSEGAHTSTPDVMPSEVAHTQPEDVVPGLQSKSAQVEQTPDSTAGTKSAKPVPTENTTHPTSGDSMDNQIAEN